MENENIKIRNRGKLIKELESSIDREPFLLDFYLADKKLTILNFHSRPYNKNPEEEITAKANTVLGWKAETSLDDAMKTAWDWEQKVRHSDTINS